MICSMSQKRHVIFHGIVRESLRDGFRVQITQDAWVYCYLSGKLRQHNIRIVLGDKVMVAVSKHDYTKGRIFYRYFN
jgi:translation initiation factor IF-1